MLAGLSSCTTVKATPSAITMLSVQNPTGQIPKLVRVSCASDSEAVTSNGFVFGAWYDTQAGIIITSNGSSGTNSASYETPVQQTPTANNEYYLSISTIDYRFLEESN